MQTNRDPAAEAGVTESEVQLMPHTADALHAVPVMCAKQDRYRCLFENNFDAIFSLDIQGRITEANLATERLTGYSLAELKGMLFTDLCAHDHKHGAMYFQALAISGTPQSVEVVAVCKDGGTADLQVTAAPIVLDGSVCGIFCLARDLTHKRRAEAQLRHDRREAERAKDRFLAVISHELRTPLMPVLTTVQMLLRQTGLPEDIRDHLAMMQRNLELESRLIDDLLDLNRIRQGKLTLNFQGVNLHEKVGNVLELCQAEIRKKQIRMELDFSADEYCLAGDPARIRQVLLNVIGNAVKYTQSGGKVTIRTCNGKMTEHCHGKCSEGRMTCKAYTPHTHFVAVHVTDTGVGMSPETLEKLFWAFERDDRQHGVVQGRGIDLAIGRALTELHGGSLIGHSRGRGKGATFTILLPLRNACLIKHDEHKSPAPSHAQKEKRILLVEDHEDTARVMGHYLRQNGYRTTVVNCVDAARRELDLHRFDLLISDIGLPDGSGIDVVRHARRNFPMPAIALSGYGMDDDIKRSMAAGFADHLVKPISVSQLQKVITHILSKQ